MYEKAFSKYMECAKEIKGLLLEKDKKWLNTMMDAVIEMDCLEAEENFIEGFRLGTRLFIECMDSDDGCLRALC